MEHYIIFGKNYYQYNGFDINKYIYHDAIVQDNVLYIEPRESFWSRYISFFYTNEYGTAIRKKLFIPFRKTAFRALLSKMGKLRKNDDNVFVFFYAEPWLFDEKGFLDYLRRKYRHAVLVYHITNTVQNIRYSVEYFKHQFDLVSTCNRGDSEKYGIPFFPNSCSYIPFDENNEPDSDCLFVGQAKNRLLDLLTIFDILTQKGITCEFYISGVKEEDKRYDNQIHYNHILDYDVILKKTEKTNVVLELLQEGMDTHTLRYPEAVSYNKKLVTNNPHVVNEKSFSEKNIRIILQASDIASVDAEFFTSPLEEDYPDKDSVSSRNFLTFIRDNLSI